MKKMTRTKHIIPKYWFLDDNESRRFFQERRRVFLSLNSEEIIQFGKDYNLYWIPRTETTEFWIKVHRVRLAMYDLPKTERQKSFDWLAERGVRHSYKVIDTIPGIY